MFCTQCGKENPTAARFCFGCGSQLGAAPTSPPAPAFPAGSSTLGLGGEATSAAGPIYAGFWRRFAAVTLDAIILSTIGSVLAVMAGAFLIGGAVAAGEGSGGIGAAGVMVGAGIWLLAILCGWLYFAASEASSAQATLGKRAMGIFVTDVHGRRPSFGRSSVRWLGRLLNTLTFGIGWLMAAFTAQKQGLHDMLAGTLVMSRPQQSSTLVVIVVLVVFALPIIGIVLSIVIPAFTRAAQ
jgi:uncharacterized RDD family membrane protein YckC